VATDKVDITEEGVSNVQGKPAYSDQPEENMFGFKPDSRQQEEYISNFTQDQESGAYGDIYKLTEGVNADYVKSRSALNEAQFAKTKTGSAKRKRDLKKLLLQYIAKYMTNPYKYVAHPKQIKNLPAWFEDALVLFDDKEMSPDMKKNVRTFFHNLVAWRDSTIGGPDDIVTQQYGEEKNIYNPEGITQEDTDSITEYSKLSGLDVGSLRRGLQDQTAPTESPVAEEAYGETPTGAQGISIATPQYSDKGLFDDTIKSQYTGAITAPAQTRPQTYVPAQREFSVVKSAGARSLANMVVGGGTTRIRNPLDTRNPLEGYLVGGRKFEDRSYTNPMEAYLLTPRAQKAKKKGRVSRQRARTTGARMSVKGKFPSIGRGSISIDSNVAAKISKVMEGIKLSGRVRGPRAGAPTGMPKVRTGGVRGYAPASMGRIPTRAIGTIDIGRNIYRSGTRTALKNITTEGMRSMNVGSAVKSVNDMTKGIMDMMPKMVKPIRKVEGEPIIRESGILGRAVMGSKTLIDKGDLRYMKEDFKFPMRGKMEYDFGIVKKKNINFVHEPNSDEYIEYVKEE
jgi:hypothetical protein